MSLRRARDIGRRASAVSGAGCGWEIEPVEDACHRPWGVIRWAFVEADFTKRADPADVPAAVRAIA